MDRPAIHDLPKPAIADRLRELGLRVGPANAMARYDFVVQGKLRVAVRVAFPSSSRRRVKVSRRQYNYVYRAWNFNFHHRGVVGDRYCDFFVCVPMGTGKPVSLEDAFVIPWSALTGKTFYLPEARRTYRGRFAVYRNDWQQIVDAAARAAAVGTRAA
jgi:hypothetical protein